MVYVFLSLKTFLLYSFKSAFVMHKLPSASIEP